MSSNPGRVAGEPAEKAPLVLLVDDLEVNIVLLEAKLEIEGCATIHALSGPSALTLAEEQSPDLIVLDVMMPKMDGFEVCRRLKANRRTADIPGMLLTTLSGSSARSRGVAAGADDFLTKPVSDRIFFERIHSLLGREVSGAESLQGLPAGKLAEASRCIATASRSTPVRC